MDNSIAMRDWTLNLAVMFMLLFVIALLFMHDPGKLEEEEAIPPGSIQVAIAWDAESCSDVDLWMQHVPNKTSVGYSNKSNRVLNLLRDDIGCNNDILTLNFENGYSRGLAPGEYIINAHLYRNHENVPIIVEYEVKIKTENRQLPVKYGHKTLTLVGEEITLARFKLNEEGHLISRSVNDIPKLIRPGYSYNRAVGVTP